jgi:hypothetical protein
VTQYARLALEDCREALRELRGGPKGLVWRVRWAAAVALLRSVGHVLDNVDSKRSAAFSKVIKGKFADLKKTKPEPLIFWEFIERERNNLLKEYRTAARQNVTIRPGVARLFLGAGSPSPREPADEGLPPLYEHVMAEGSFNGQDPRDLVARAIEWWKKYLDEIDVAVDQIK